MANLRMQEANVGMSQTLALADLLRGGTGMAGASMQSAFGNQMQGLQWLAQNASGDPRGNALAGGISGAAAGSSAGWGGALAGGVAGAIGGYYS